MELVNLRSLNAVWWKQQQHYIRHQIAVQSSLPWCGHVPLRLKSRWKSFNVLSKNANKIRISKSHFQIQRCTESHQLPVTNMKMQEKRTTSFSSCPRADDALLGVVLRTALYRYRTDGRELRGEEAHLNFALVSKCSPAAVSNPIQSNLDISIFLFL